MLRHEEQMWQGKEDDESDVGGVGGDEGVHVMYVINMNV